MFPCGDNLNPGGSCPPVRVNLTTLFAPATVASKFFNEGIPASTVPKSEAVVNATPTSISPYTLNLNSLSVKTNVVEVTVLFALIVKECSFVTAACTGSLP